MPDRLIIFLSCTFVLALMIVMRMIMKNRLREVHAVIWICVVFSIPLAMVCYPLILKFSVFMGFISPANFVIFSALGILFVVCIHFSALGWAHQRCLKNMVQKVSALEAELTALRKETAASRAAEQQTDTAQQSHN